MFCAKEGIKVRKRYTEVRKCGANPLKLLSTFHFLLFVCLFALRPKSTSCPTKGCDCLIYETFAGEDASQQLWSLQDGQFT